MAYLRLKFSPVLSADRHILPTEDELLAEIVLEVVDDKAVHTIFRQKWNIRCLVDWIVRTKNLLLHEKQPDFLDSSKPTVFAIDRIFDNYDEQSLDAVVDKLYEFRLTHDLRFAMRGTNIPSVIICKKEFNYEVSWRNADIYDAYQIDLPKFINALCKFAESDIYTLTTPRYLLKSICLK